MTDPFPATRASRLIPFRRRPQDRHGRQRRWNDLMARIDELDRALEDLVRRRREAARELTELVDNYWPRMFDEMGYRPPVAKELPLPDIAPDAEALGSSRLRSVAVTLLRRYGESDLTTLHRLLILHGYVIGSATPVKALADAMRYETIHQRAVRVRRAVYRVDPRFVPEPDCFGDVPLIPPTPWIARASDPLPLPRAA